MKLTVSLRLSFSDKLWSSEPNESVFIDSHI